MCRKKNKVEAVRVAKYLAACLHKQHGKHVLSMFAVHYQKETKHCCWDCDNYPLYSEEKSAQDVIDEKLFAWLELPDDFSLNSN